MEIDEVLRLTENARLGDMESFGVLFKSFERELYLYAMSMLKDSEEAQDVVQDTALRAMSGIRKLNDVRYCKTWMMRILINQCKTRRLDKLKKNNIVINHVDIWYEPLNVEELELWNALDELSEKYKKIIILHFINDFTVKEISNVLHLPEGTVKSRLHRALTNMKKILDGSE